MGYLLLAVALVLLAATLALWALKLLHKQPWFLGWLRGTVGMALVFGGALLMAMAWDVYTYQSLQAEQNIATISFKRLDEQQYLATFVGYQDEPQTFELHGDQWQLDSRIIKWHGLFSRVGMKTGYRLDRLSGRYLSLDDEQTKARSAYALQQSFANVDVWDWLQQFNVRGIVDARYGNSTFLPMVDAGQYQISVGVSGLLARPLNEPARTAVNQWR